MHLPLCRTIILRLLIVIEVIALTTFIFIFHLFLSNKGTCKKIIHIFSTARSLTLITNRADKEVTKSDTSISEWNMHWENQPSVSHMQTAHSLHENFWSATRWLSVRQKFSPGQRENLQDRQTLVSNDNNLGLENIILVFRGYCFSAFLPKKKKNQKWRQKQMKFWKKWKNV